MPRLMRLAVACSIPLVPGMWRTVPAESPAAAEPHTLPEKLRARWPELVLAVAFLAGFPLFWGIPVSHDVVWQMWIARQIEHGAKLYADIVEINPPLWFWLALPVERLADFLAVFPPRMMAAAVYVYGGAALLCVALLVADMPARRRAFLLAAAFLATTVVAIPAYAQREHIALIAAIPYAVLLARRAEGAMVDARLALAIGVMAALGFALKHYFVIVPAGLELWLFLRLRFGWRPVRPETVALVALAAAYALALVHFAPDFFKIIVPLVNLAYDGYKVPSLDQLAKPWVLAWALALFALFRERRVVTPLCSAFAIAGMAFAASYFIQAKGWNYHALPATGCLFLAVAAQSIRWDFAALLRNPLPAAALAAPLLISSVAGPYANPLQSYMSGQLETIPRGSVAFFISLTPSRMWPAIAIRGDRWPSRYFSFWMLPSLARFEKEHGRLSPALQDIADKLRKQLLHDLTCNPPELIIVDNVALSPSLDGADFDYLRFFRRNMALAAFLDRYSHTRDHDVFDIFRKPKVLGVKRPTGCRDIAVL
jgi:hypothetical protein